MTSYEYWSEREAKQKEETIRSEEEYSRRLSEIYERMYYDCQAQIEQFYARYAGREGITLAEARRRVSQLDIERYERLAERYVKERNFSPEANEQMRLYNATMRINRLEMLKAELGREMCAGYSDMEHTLGEVLSDEALKELKRQAGILGMGTEELPEKAKTIAGMSFEHATFSQRLWQNQEELKAALDIELQRGLVQGKNPRELARTIRRRFDQSQTNAERLMRTEMCRAQTQAQKESFEAGGFEEFMFICNDGACPDCMALDGKIFPVKKLQPGLNAPPVHPNCRCSTAAYMDREAFEKWLEELEREKIISPDVTQDGIKTRNVHAVKRDVAEPWFRNAHFKSPIDNDDYLDSVWNTATDTNITPADVAYVRRNIHQISSKQNIGRVVTLSSMDYVYVIEMIDYLEYNILWKVPNDDSLNDAIARKRRRR